MSASILKHTPVTGPSTTNTRYTTTTNTKTKQQNNTMEEIAAPEK